MTNEDLAQEAAEACSQQLNTALFNGLESSNGTADFDITPIILSALNTATKQQEAELASCRQQIMMDTECIERIRTEAMRLEAELEKLREDKEALDWLEKQTLNDGGSYMEWSDVLICGPKNHSGKFPTGWLITVESVNKLGEASGATLLEALSAARKASNE